MEVIKITENEDGSATLDLNLTEQEINSFVEYAVVDILEKQISRYEEDNERYCFRCDSLIEYAILTEFPDSELCRDCIINDIKKL